MVIHFDISIYVIYFDQIKLFDYPKFTFWLIDLLIIPPPNPS